MTESFSKSTLAALLLLSGLAMVQQRSSTSEAGEPVNDTKKPAGVISDSQLENFAQLAIEGIPQQYPNKPSNVMASAEDVLSPQEMHPVFFGSFDWHSSVHGHWMLVKLLKTSSEHPSAASIRQLLNEQLSADKLQQEARYFGVDSNKSFERMYGWAWALQLVAELHAWEDEDGQRWRENLRPLETVIVERICEYLPKLSFPIRTGVHEDTGFALAMELDYTRAVGDEELEQLLIEKAKAFYLGDTDYPAHYEPSGHDFFSSGFNEADLMRRVLGREAFSEWLDRLLPQLRADAMGTMIEPVEVPDVTDGHLVHLAGLNLSRAWTMAGIASALEEQDPRRQILEAAVEAHAAAGLKYVNSGHYEGEHWLATFAVYYLTANERTQPAATELSVAERPEELAPLLLAEGGKSLLPIVISEQACETTKAVAAELAEYLQKITGAAFEVVAGDGARGIVLGTLAEFPDPELDEPLAINSGFDGKEAYAIRTEPERLRLIGATEKGVSHAVFALLESLGCRWFFPAPEWEVVPSTPTLRVTVNETERPALLARRIWYGYGFFPEPRKPSVQTRPALDYAGWGRHNRMAQSFTVYCGHAWQNIIADNQAAFDQHPEYRALVDGKRHGEQLCVSNPAVRQLAVRWALDFLERKPSADMVSMEPSDGGGQCECEACAELGSISDRVFGLANEVARAVAKERPGKLVGLYAYNEHCEPPSFDLEPNVYVQLTAGFNRGRYSFDELVELWPQRCQNLGFYEYFSVWLWDFDRLPGGRAADIGYLKKQIPRYVDAGATSLDCESGNNWGPHGRGYYIANKLMWNPEADVEALLADFYEQAFGPAAEPMRRYYERFDPSNKPLMSTHLLGLGFRDVEEAAKRAADRPDVQTRLDHIKQYLRYVHLRWMIDRETDEEKRKQLTLDTFTHVYRTRYSYMNHWEAIRQGWIPQAVDAFDEPSWSSRDPAANPPWAVNEPFTREETEAAFREGLAFFQPEAVTEKSFSNTLIPVDFGEHSATVESSQAYQGGLRYALYSVAGEPLTLDVIPGTIAWYRDRAAAKWDLTDAAGKRLAGGSLPLDGESHPIEVPVSGPGLYYFEFDDSGAGWKINVAADRRATIELDRSSGFAHAGWMQPMHFYVPKGTEELQYYWSGGPHWVHGPDGTKLKEVETDGGFVKIPVPEGADGKTWHFTRLALGHLWFFNAPNYLAASPAGLLVPKELAQRDGLASD